MVIQIPLHIGRYSNTYNQIKNILWDKCIMFGIKQKGILVSLMLKM